MYPVSKCNPKPSPALNLSQSPKRPPAKTQDYFIPVSGSDPSINEDSEVLSPKYIHPMELHLNQLLPELQNFCDILKTFIALDLPLSSDVQKHCVLSANRLIEFVQTAKQKNPRAIDAKVRLFESLTSLSDSLKRIPHPTNDQLRKPPRSLLDDIYDTIVSLIAFFKSLVMPKSDRLFDTAPRRKTQYYLNNMDCCVDKLIESISDGPYCIKSSQSQKYQELTSYDVIFCKV